VTSRRATLLVALLAALAGAACAERPLPARPVASIAASETASPTATQPSPQRVEDLRFLDPPPFVFTVTPTPTPAPIVTKGTMTPEVVLIVGGDGIRTLIPGAPSGIELAPKIIGPMYAGSATIGHETYVFYTRSRRISVVPSRRYQVTLVRVPLRTGVPEQVDDFEAERAYASVSPDGTRVAFGGIGGLRVRSLIGGAELVFPDDRSECPAGGPSLLCVFTLGADWVVNGDALVIERARYEFVENLVRSSLDPARPARLLDVRVGSWSPGSSLTRVCGTSGGHVDMLNDPDAFQLDLRTLTKRPLPPLTLGEEVVVTGCAAAPSGEVLVTYASRALFWQHSLAARWFGPDLSVVRDIAAPLPAAERWLPDGSGVLMRVRGQRDPDTPDRYFILDRNGDLWDLDTGGAEILDVLPREALP
jgi:hypothetical protein